ncbi:hypothetical protein ACFYV7_24225 [Nocardia suismassiliense]|uniref:Uncharacterized protein n=1 Tax=Nocardia suismassiliense TaxID=2077092 RepID=A0ABW6QXD1_9NOCA
MLARPAWVTGVELVEATRQLRGGTELAGTTSEQLAERGSSG